MSDPVQMCGGPRACFANEANQSGGPEASLPRSETKASEKLQCDAPSPGHEALVKRHSKSVAPRTSTPSSSSGCADAVAQLVGTCGPLAIAVGAGTLGGGAPGVVAAFIGGAVCGHAATKVADECFTDDTSGRTAP